MKQSILFYLVICLSLYSLAQTGPRLVGLSNNNAFQYIGGDTTITIYRQEAYTTPRSATMVETPDGKLYGTGVASNYGGIIEYDYPTNTVANPFYFNTGEVPIAPLLLASDGKLYGTSFDGGVNNGGFIFSYTPGSNSTVRLVDLDTNANPYGALIQASDGNLYGMTQSDGPNNSGRIYQYNISSGTYTRLYDLPRPAAPEGALLEIGADTLYGLTSGAGSLSVKPTIFRFVVATGSFTVLDSLPVFCQPKGALIRATDGNLYGLGSYAGLYNKGLMFRYNMASGILDTLHNFGSGTDGATPQGELYQASDGMLYGMTSTGGINGQGTVFRYDISTSTYTLMVNMASPVTAAYYGHLIEYKVLPVRRHPVNASMCAGYSYVNFISADTSASATAQWQVSADSGATYSNIAGATDTLYSFSPSAGQNGNLYRAIFSHNGQSDTSLSATLTVWPIDTTFLNESICYGQSVTVYASTFNTTGIHVVNLPNFGVHGCDSVVSLNLTVYPMASDTTSASICQGQAYIFDSTTYTSTGIYKDTLTGQSIHGCDSVRTLILTVNPSASGTTTQAICPGSSYTLGSNTYTITGIYVDTLTGAAMYGCDSIVTLNLFVLDTTTAYFYLQPSDSAHVWFIINQSFGTGLTYVWHWGDSTSSTGDTASHTYASAGYYNICVTVTDSAGCSANYCDTSVYLYKNQSGQMVYVDVLPQYPAGINTVNTENLNINYYGGAVHFSEALLAPTQLKLYDLSGRVVMEQNNFSGNVWNINSDIAQGVYVIHLQNGSYSLSKKLMIMQ